MDNGDPSYLVELLLIGLSLGCLYALVALGYSLVYGVVRVINFSHGEMYAFGAYAGYVVIVPLGLPLFVAVPAAALATGGLVYLVERFVFRPASGSALSLLVTHIGVSVVLRSSLAMVFGEQFRSLREAGDNDTISRFGSATFSSGQSMVAAATVIVGGVLWWIVARSPYGRSLRAASADSQAAAAKGISVGPVVARAYALGGVCAGVAGVLGAN